MTCNTAHSIVFDVLCPKTSTEQKKWQHYFGTFSANFPSLAMYVHVNQIGQAYSFKVIHALILLRNNYAKDIVAILGIDLI